MARLEDLTSGALVRGVTLGQLGFIDGKGRVTGATAATVTQDETLTALNQPEPLILALIEVAGDQGTVTYPRQPFANLHDFAAAWVNHEIKNLVGASLVIG